MKQALLIIFAFATQQTPAQTSWTMQQCMRYAVEHNHEVKRAELELDNYKTAKTGAIGRFLPLVEAGIGVQYNFGRAIDPETNGYTNVSTFYNGYQLSASLPVFDIFSRVHALKAAQASILMGRHSLRFKQDQIALSVLQAFTNVAYYEGLVTMADEKVKETTLLLRQTQALEEVGRKSVADVAQVESQKAEAEYELTHQQNLYASALLELKKAMAFPMADTLTLSAGSHGQGPSQPVLSQEVVPIEPMALADSSFFILHSSFNWNPELNPELKAAHYQMQMSKHEWHQARASLLPTLSLSVGMQTTYYKTLHSETAASFGNQFNNNMGEYVSFTLSIPLFNRLQTITNIRRAKNNHKIACESYEQTQLELEKLHREAWQDWQGYLKQTIQMEKKVEADSLAYLLTRRQFEEGLTTAIDLHTTSSQLLHSKATLLQCRLMAIVKQQLVRYYQGETIWTE